jgi:hypothetical protein
MQLIYYAHSYRPDDHAINEFFQELMLDEAFVPSLDPQSDHLNAAKPERHLRSTDAIINKINKTPILIYTKNSLFITKKKVPDRYRIVSPTIFLAIK